MLRWLKFAAVGVPSAAGQVLLLSLLVSLGCNYLVATALAVEAAILNNCFWHIRWTWRDRTAGPRSEMAWTRVAWRFHAANGLISILSNVVLMRLFTGQMGIPVAAANLLAIALTSVLNFYLGDRWVFVP